MEKEYKVVDNIMLQSNESCFPSKDAALNHCLKACIIVADEDEMICVKRLPKGRVEFHIYDGCMELAMAAFPVYPD
jgi:hypothetical protein